MTVGVKMKVAERPQLRSVFEMQLFAGSRSSSEILPSESMSGSRLMQSSWQEQPAKDPRHGKLGMASIGASK
jgi:hypothetical protein